MTGVPDFEEMKSDLIKGGADKVVLDALQSLQVSYIENPLSANTAELADNFKTTARIKIPGGDEGVQLSSVNFADEISKAYLKEVIAGMTDDEKRFLEAYRVQVADGSKGVNSKGAKQDWMLMSEGDKQALFNVMDNEKIAFGGVSFKPDGDIIYKQHYIDGDVMAKEGASLLKK
jgi:hypothetical protein